MHAQTLFGDFDFSSGWADSVSPQAAREILARTRVVESGRDSRLRIAQERRELARATHPDATPTVLEDDDFLATIDAVANGGHKGIRPPGEVHPAPRTAPRSSGRVAPANGAPDIAAAAPTQSSADEPAVAARVSMEQLPDAVRENIQESRQALIQEAQEATGETFIPVEDFVLDADILAEERSPKQKAQDNIEAIKTAKLVLMAGRPATREEKTIMARYVGWGGLQYAFYDIHGKAEAGWESIARQLQDILTPDEHAKARSTILDAHYTSGDVVRAMWAGITRMGFRGGSMIEPAGGAGNFLGLQPPDIAARSQRFLVEIDPITSNIARLLYPRAFIANAPFETFSTGGAKFDLFVGNPPFGDLRLIDRRGGADQSVSPLTTRLATNTHNYFFGRAAEGLRPGGIAAMVVSRYLLDASTVDAVDFRAALGREMKLVDAVRLPDSAFRQNAGTEVVTDILFLQKRAEPLGEEQARELDWVETVDFENPDARTADVYPTVRINRWYANHPEKVLGQLTAGRGMYRDGELMVRPTDDWRKRLQSAMEDLPERVMPETQATIVLPQSAASDSVEPPPGLLPGQMFLWKQPSGEYAVRRKSALAAFGVEVSGPVEFDTPVAQRRTVEMLRIHETLRELMRAQVDPDAPAERVESHRSELRARYDAFQREFGYLKRAANRRLVRTDPSWTLLSSLEINYDDGLSAAVARKTNSTPREPGADKADVFTKRTQWPPRRAQSAANARDALAISLGESGTIDPMRMMELTGKDWWELRDDLGDQVLFDPIARRWVERAELVSGDVLTKAELTKRAQSTEGSRNETGTAAARLDVEIARSVQILADAAPPRKRASEIVVLPGASWVPMTIVRDFAKEICGPNGRIEYTEQSGRWTVGGPTYGGDPRYCTNRKTAAEIVSAVFNGKSAVVHDQVDGVNFVNQEQTALAKQKAEAVIARWLEFATETPERAQAIEDAWNATFNRTVQRVYDGSHLTLEGSSAAITLRPHQKNAVWRVVQSDSTLLDHVVGAGKTFAAVGAIMESRRMGRTKKAMMVVPNNLVGQWRDAFSTLYPAARVLAAEADDMAAGNRQQFLAKAAFGDWDAIIMPHSSFGLIPPDPDHEMRYIEEQVALLKHDLLSSKERVTRKEIEKAIKRAELKVRSIAQTRKDEGIHFGMLGVDFLGVDEAHLFKNVSYTTQLQVSGLGNPAGSARANDMMLKTSFIRGAGGKIMFATGTPISNSLAEMYILQRYLDPGTLEAQRLYSFDAWQRSYAQVSSEFAFTLTGKFKEKSVLARFVNLDGLLASYRGFADVITRADMNRLLQEAGQPRIDIPEVRGGKPFIHVSPMSPVQRQLMGEQVDMTENGHPVYSSGSILWRLDNLPKGAPKKGDDNVLVIISDIRKVGLDARAYNPAAPRTQGGKLQTCVDNVYDSWRRFEDDRGTQLIFLDFCTPQSADSPEVRRIRELAELAEGDDANAAEAAEDELAKFGRAELDAALRGGSFDAYATLRAELVQRGVQADQIAFIHDYDTPAKRDRLFAAVNAGQVRVLVGSTSKMGAGMNVQQRLTDIHHLDAPYRPSDLEQRNGRGLRQGNQLLAKYGHDTFQVGIHDYVTEDSGDAGLWQILETKQAFIEQVRTGVAGGELDNPESAAIDPGRVKAMASGNEILMDEVRLKDELQKKEHLIRAARQDHAAWAHRVQSLRHSVDYARRVLPDAETSQGLARAAVAAIEQRADALRQEVEAIQREGRKHPAKDALDIVSKIPVHRFAPVHGTTEEGTNLAAVGATLALVAVRSAGARTAQCVGELNGVPLFVQSRHDYSVYPATVRAEIGVGHGECIVWSRSASVDGSDSAGSLGRAAWSLVTRDLVDAHTKAEMELASREQERARAIAAKPQDTEARAIADLSQLRERHDEAVLALRLGYRKWETFHADAPKRAAERAKSTDCSESDDLQVPVAS